MPSLPEPTIVKTKEVATDYSILGYTILRSPDGFAKSQLVVHLAYGKQKMEKDPFFTQYNLFDVFKEDYNYICYTFDELYKKLQAKVGIEDSSITKEELDNLLVGLISADTQNNTLITTIIDLLDRTNIKKLTTEEVARLV